MNKNKCAAWTCSGGGGQIPVVATVTGVVTCFAESFLKKHFVLGSSFGVALALAQAIPFAIVLRYLATRLRGRSSLTPTPRA